MHILFLFFFLYFTALSPLPALPALLSAYQAYSYYAIPVVYLALLCASISHYFLGLLFSRYGSQVSIFPRKLIAALNSRSTYLSNLSLKGHIPLVFSGIIPTKVYCIACGYSRVDFCDFLVATTIPVICLHPFYLLGGSLSGLVRDYLNRYGIAPFLSWLLSIIFAYLLGCVAYSLFKIIFIFAKKFLIR